MLQEFIAELAICTNHIVIDTGVQNAKRYDSVLPTEFVEEFEKRFIRTRDSETIKGLRKKSRAYSHWKAAQKVIVELQIDPSDWFYSIHEIYDHFCRRRLSLRYINSILKFVNLWGYFISKKLARPYHPVPIPRGYERQRILDAFYEKDGYLCLEMNRSEICFSAIKRNISREIG